MTTTILQRPRGARPTPRHKLAGATPHRITGPTPPQFAVVPSRLSMWLNDVDGDCVSAEEAFAKAAAALMAGQPELFIQDSTVMSWANAHGVLNGAELHEVLVWMQQGGFSQDGQTYDDGPAVAVDWTNAALLQNAIAQGPVKIGVAADQLQNVVGNSNGWFATGFSPDSNEDHCVALCGYGTFAWLATQLGVQVPAGMSMSQPGYLLFTWSTIGIIDVPSLLAICGEAWLRTPTTVIVGPTPTPAPIPPVPPPVPVPPMPTPPVPVPPTPPPPVPPPTIQQEIDSLFALLETQASGSPWLVAVLRIVNTYIDSLFASHAGGLHLASRYSADGTKGAIPPLLIQLIDGGFAMAEKAYPQYAAYLQLLQRWIDAYLPLL